MKTVDLSERITVTYYDDEYEEWSQKTVAISDVLDSVCDDYTVIEAEPKYAYVIVDEDGNMKCSNCGSGNCFDNYCGHCGAKLIEERKDEVEDVT